MRVTTCHVPIIASWLSLSFLGILVARPTLAGPNGCTHDIECDDGLPCTIDLCDFPTTGPAGSGTCQHTPVPDGQSGGIGGPDCAERFGLHCGGCDDGLFCNGAEACQVGACVPGTPPCSGVQVCSESLNLCQPGPCSGTKTCIGGPTPGAACTGTNNCGSGGLCRYAECHDGLHCNGEETCVAGVCQAGENPCGFGALCGERQCSIGPHINICLSDEDCLPNGSTGVGGTCSLIGPVCQGGRCCTNSTEPTCGIRSLKGLCSGASPGTNSGSACSANSECNSNNCVLLGIACPAVGGQFYAGDAGRLSGKLNCPFIDDFLVRCPKYASGIAPDGFVIDQVGPVGESSIPNGDAGVAIHRIGDDYKFSNSGICVGGTRDGLGCGGNGDCLSGGVCNLAGSSAMSVYYIRLIGWFVPETRIVVEFRDSAGRFVTESFAERETLPVVERLLLDPPLIVPSEGFVILRVANEFTPNGAFIWSSTDAVDVGANDPDVLWLNDGPVANFLAPNPGILAFEIEGEKVALPTGACCDGDGMGCTDGVLPWVCEGDGNHFQGVGTTCPLPACDTGACCTPNGECTVGTDTDCAQSGGDFQGFGTDCDPNCCDNPLYTGGDRCEDATVHALAVPSVMTITGDNTSASLQPGEPMCHGGIETPPIDLGWYEAFSTVECAMIRVDYCCTDPVKRPAYPVLFDECPCAAPIMSMANPYLFPQPATDRGAPYCEDDNQWAAFGPLPPGTYYIPVQSGVPGSFGPYQMHVTAEACPTAACCVADQCTDDVNQLECDALGGTFLGPPSKAPLVPDCSTSPCATGSCCTGPGECIDVQLNQPFTKANCDSLQGTFFGGVRCQGGTCANCPVESCSVSADCPCGGNCLADGPQYAQPSPCPLCSIEGANNCQSFDDSLNFTPSDRSLGFDGMLSADDFRPEGTVLDHICVWGFYLNMDPDASQADCGPVVLADRFRVRVYSNDPATGRSPGVLFGESMATSQRGIIPNTLVQTRLQVEQYGYELVLNTPIVGLAPGEVYWLEVSNDVSNSIETCRWFWSQQNPTQTSFSFHGNNAGYPVHQSAPFENVFCLNFGFSPLAEGSLDGACCTCDGLCSVKTYVDCARDNGVWDITRMTCDGVTCPSSPPANDNCLDGPQTITEGSYIVNNQCATTDGFGPIGEWPSSQIDYDLWYYFIAQQACDLVVSECQTGLLFDSALSVYHNPANPTQCPSCPLDATTSAETLAGLPQDESCTGTAVGGAGYWRATEQLGRNALPGECYLIRVGSFPGQRGTAILDISCDPCTPSLSPPCDPYPVEHTRFIAIGCSLFHPCLEPMAVEGAIRVRLVSLHHVEPPYTGGPSVPFTAFEGQIRWVGPPAQYPDSNPTPYTFWVSQLQCAPHYQDWSDLPLVYVTGSEIVPSSTYEYELLDVSCMGSEETCSDVSETFTIRTRRWGDVEEPYNPPSTTAQPDLVDVSALVNKFRNQPGAPSKARALLAGIDALGNLDLMGDLNFTHIAACVDAFRGRPYGYQMQSCP